MERHQVRELMSELKPIGIRAAYDWVLTNALKRQHPAQQIVGTLLQAAIAERQARSVRYKVGIAKLPLIKELAEFDFSGAPINEALSARHGRRGIPHRPTQRHTGRRHRHRQNASGGGNRPDFIRLGRRVWFSSVIDLVRPLEAEARAGKTGRLAEQLTRLDLIVLANFPYLPFALSGGQLLFRLISYL